MINPIAWTRDVFDAPQPSASGGYLLNFPDAGDPGPARAAFGADLPKLAVLKRTRDPTNPFNLDQNVAPTP